MPVIAGIAYEAIKWGAAHLEHPIVSALMAPGLALQALTTREPDASQIEVAARALYEVLRLERPEGYAAMLRPALPLALGDIMERRERITVLPNDAGAVARFLRGHARRSARAA